MTSNGEKKPEAPGKPHWFEQPPKDKTETAKKIGGLAVKGAQKDKGKK